jgi:serine/threonine protein kinase
MVDLEPVSSADRFCPLCDDQLAAEVCPKHRVPTIASTPSDPAIKPEPGVIIGSRYRIERVLGQGGMGTIFIATHVGIDGEVVLKVLRDSNAQQRTYLRRFYQEARAISRLDHPNVVQVIEFGFDALARVPFLVMEHVSGRTLRELIRDEGQLDERRAASITLQISRALLEAHEKGVLHRDLKPDNIMISRLADGEEHVKVLDFGLAKLTEGDPSTPPLTVPGRVVGTPSFMAPEQVMHTAQDFRTDLYGLGCVLHALLTARPPFFGKDRLEVMRKKVREPPPSLPERLVNGATPSRGLLELHAALLATDRNGRPASTRAVVRVLGAIASGADVVDIDSIRSLPPTRPDGRLPSHEPKPFPANADTVPLVPTVFDAKTQIAAPPTHGVRVELAHEDEVSDAELETLRAVLALDVEPLSGVVKVAEEVEPTRRIKDPAALDEESADGALTSVLPTSLESPPSLDGVEAPTPLIHAKDLDQGPTAPNARISEPPAPFSLRSGVVLTLASVVAGTILALGVMRLISASRAPAPQSMPPVTGRDIPRETSARASPRATVSIVSDPPGAEVFDGEARLGTTPLDIPRPERGSEKTLRLRLEGFEDQSILLDSATELGASVELKLTRGRTRKRGP